MVLYCHCIQWSDKKLYISAKYLCWNSRISNVHTPGQSLMHLCSTHQLQVSLWWTPSERLLAQYCALGIECKVQECPQPKVEPWHCFVHLLGFITMAIPSELLKLVPSVNIALWLNMLSALNIHNIQNVHTYTHLNSSNLSSHDTWICRCNCRCFCRSPMCWKEDGLTLVTSTFNFHVSVPHHRLSWASLWSLSLLLTS